MAGTLIIECMEQKIPIKPPSINIPNFGIMEQAWGALDQIPDTGKMLAEFQNSLALALAPMKAYLEIIEALMAVYECVKAVPNAIMELDPGTVLDCIYALYKLIAKLLQLVPPWAYIRTAMGVMSYAIDLIDEILSIMNTLDSKITALIATWEEAELLQDTDLQEIVGCASKEIQPILDMIMDAVRFITPINDILMTVFMRLMPTDELKKIVEQYQETAAYMNTLKSAVSLSSWGEVEIPEFPGFTSQTKTQHKIVAVPVLDPVFTCLARARMAMVWGYNTLALATGDEPDKEDRAIPNFKNF